MVKSSNLSTLLGLKGDLLRLSQWGDEALVGGRLEPACGWLPVASVENDSQVS